MNKYFRWPIVIVVPLVLLFFSVTLTSPITGSHYYRQTQTAQVSQAFIEEGWNPFMPKLRMAGKPGYVLLEFPIYQSIAAGISAVFSLDVALASRLLNILFGFLFALGFSECLTDVRKYLAPHKIVNDSYWSWALLIFCTPMIFSLSQWVSVELMNATLALWSTALAIKFLFKSQNILIVFSFLVCLTTSLLIKPNAFYASFLVVIWALLKSPASKKGINTKIVLVVIMMFSFMIAAAWFFYGQRINSQYSNMFSISGAGGHYFSPDLDLKFLTNIGGRILLYILGPGTLLYLVLLGEKTLINKELIIVLLTNIVLYLLTFSHLNKIHNYYQLPIVFPFFLAVSLVFKISKQKWRQYLFVFCIIINITVGWFYLNRPNVDLHRMTEYWKTKLLSGYEEAQIQVIGNEAAISPLLSYVLRRYSRHCSLVGAIKCYNQAVKQNDKVVFACDLNTIDNCVELAINTAPICNNIAYKIGSFWSCIPNGEL